MKKLFLIILFSNFIFAYVGKITALKGSAEVIRNSIVIPAKIGMKIENKDTIKTKNGKLQIIFSDRTIITIGKNSTFKVNDYLFSNQNPKAKFGLRRGIIKTITGKIGKIAPDRFKIKTKNALIGIRGTIFIVEFKNDITTLTTLSGITTFQDIQTNKLFTIKSGQQIILNPKAKTRIIIKQTIIPPVVINEKTTKQLTQQTKTTQQIQQTTISTNEVNTIVNDITTQDTTQTIQNNTETSENSQQTSNEVSTSTTDTTSPTKVTLIQNNIYSLGYFKYEEPTDTWYSINYDETTPTEIDNLIANYASGQYIGSLVAITNDGVLTGNINFSFYFGDQWWSGDLTFGNNTNNYWHLGAEGSLNNSGFTSTSVYSIDDSTAQGVSGSISGKFYGPNAAAIGGNGEVQSTNKGSAKFSFSGTKE